MWEDLSFKDKSKLIELGASQGILDLSTIKHLYNINADGGYLKWKKEIEKYKGIDIDNDNKYNYQAFFEEDPQRAWGMLKKDSKAHFTDKYKTVWHPTFSDESVYSGHKSKYNPQGLVGGHWEGNTFKMSDSLYNSPVSMDDRKQYLIDNEPNGTVLLESNGTLPVFDGIPWGGVLPEVTVTPQHSDGGSIHIAKNKRGTFKAQASRMGMSTQQAASHILANKDNYSPAMVKKAVFAHNFAHADGGPLDNTFPEAIDNLHTFGDGGTKMTKDRRYRHVTEIYQSFIDNGATPQVALDLTNQKIAEQGWTGYISGDKVRYDNVDDFTQHVIDHYKRMYPDSLKANNFNQFFRGIESTSKYKYNPSPESYRKKLEITRPGVKKRINAYRNEQGLHPLALLTPDTEIPDISDASEPLGKSSFYGAYGGHLYGESGYKPSFTKFVAQVNNRNIITDRGSDETTQSNDATWVYSGKKMLYDHKSKRVMDISRRQNPELRKRGIEGGRKHSEWEKKHPVLNGIGTLMGAAPLAIATAPMATVAGDAVAGTALGHAVTGGLTGLNTLTANSTWFPWVNTGVTSLSISDGIRRMKNGDFSPETILETAPLIGAVPRTIGIVKNLRPQSIRNYVYVSKAPIGYDGKKDALIRVIDGISSGKPADIDNPWWFTRQQAKKLDEYAVYPKTLSDAERESYLADFENNALKARADMWRIYNHIPQKYGTFTPSKLHNGAYTAEKSIKDLKYIPDQIKGQPQKDFVTTVGGNIGIPEVYDLGFGRTFRDGNKQWGVTITKDWFDLHPFSRPNDRIIKRYVQPLFEKAVASPIKKVTGKTIKTPKFNFLKPLEDKVANFEIGRLVGSDPVLVQYDIPWTWKQKFIESVDGNTPFSNAYTYTPAFQAEDFLPEPVINWERYYKMFNNPTINYKDMFSNITTIK